MSTVLSSITNCALLPLLVLLSPWSYATFVAEASSAVNVSGTKSNNSPYKIVSLFLTQICSQSSYRTHDWVLGNHLPSPAVSPVLTAMVSFFNFCSDRRFLLATNHFWMTDFRWGFDGIASSHFRACRSG